MGIPSYFSYIVKNHNNILIKLNKLNKNIDNLYLDIYTFSADRQAMQCHASCECSHRKCRS